MLLIYKKAGEIHQTETSNSDLLVSDYNGQVCNITITAVEEIELLHAEVEITHSFYKNDFWFLNGYQSWTETKEFSKNEKLHNLNKLPSFIEKTFAFKNYGSQAFYPILPKEKYAYDVAYVEGKNPIFIGNRNFKNAYLIIVFNRKKNKIILKSDVFGKKLQKQEKFVLFDYVVSPLGKEYGKTFFNLFTPKSNQKMFGYTSWYNHYQNISEEKVLKALQDADERFDLFQVDDGFEPFVGDWLTCDSAKFPNGLEPIVKAIHNQKMKAGIWLAPFVAERKSRLVQEHPNWFPKDEKGNPILAGANWSGFYPLDLNQSEVIQYIKDVLRHYVALGFDFFKLDFLYACNLYPLQGKTRAETSDFAYQILFDELKEKCVLGCGAILSSAYEKFDFMRIGPDVSLIFDDVFYMRLFHPERISTKVTIGNTVFRYPMNGHVFQNDPDVFLLRDDNIHLTWQQRYALTKMNALFGSLFMTSDNPKEYDETKQLVLEEDLKLFREANQVEYIRVDNTIRVTYLVKEESHAFTYDMEKGIIFDER